MTAPGCWMNAATSGSRGRTKDIIIRGGENIPVVEIENLLLTHPAIKEIALVPLPHERLGETACACVVLQPGDARP